MELPALQAEKQHAQTTLESVQGELARTRLDRAAEHAALTDQVGSLTSELQKLSAENAVLRSELAKTVHQKQVTNTKLEQIRKKLGLTESEAKAFIQVWSMTGWGGAGSREGCGQREMQLERQTQ